MPIHVFVMLSITCVISSTTTATDPEPVVIEVVRSDYLLQPEEVSFSGPVKNSHLKHLDKYRSVKTVTIITGDHPFPTDLSPLWAHKNLKRLVVGSATPPDSSTFDALPKTQLKTFDCGIATDAILEKVSSCRSIYHITISTSDVTNDGFKGFANHENLYLLMLKDCPKISDNVMNALNQIKKLKELSFENCGISDKGLQLMKHHERYTGFFIDGEQITDRSLPVLKLFTNATRMSLENTSLTKSAISELKAALPNCEIYSDYDSPQREK